MSAGLSGLFSVEVRQAADHDGKPMEGWARVIVKKEPKQDFHRQRGLEHRRGVAYRRPAHRSRGLLRCPPRGGSGELDPLGRPPRANRGEVKDPQSLVEKVDGLGRDFLKAWLDKELPDLLGPEGQAILNRMRTVVDTYDNAEAQVLAVVDGYLDEGEQAMDALVQQIQRPPPGKRSRAG